MKIFPQFNEGDRVIDRTTGRQLTIIKVEAAHSMPTLSRYLVRQPDGTTISNFPGYLLRRE